jgi:hypothetical protein
VPDHDAALLSLVQRVIALGEIVVMAAGFEHADRQFHIRAEIVSSEGNSLAD